MKNENDQPVPAVRIAQNIPLKEIRNELLDNALYWENLNNDRHLQYKVQREAKAILLRWAYSREGVREPDEHITIDMPAISDFPVLSNWLYQFADKMQGELSRVSIARLQPGKRVFRHWDKGDYYVPRDRYHLVVNSPHGSDMMCGDQVIRWFEGELWWFDNKLEHEAKNSFDVDRDHIIFDLLLNDERDSVSSLDSS
jgi:hypothetical protein